MIQRLYVHNYRCLENFELDLRGHSSALLIGKNGAGKSSVGAALEVLQGIGRGASQASELVGAGDFAQGRTSAPMRFTIAVSTGGLAWEYEVAFEVPAGMKEPRVFEESLAEGGELVYRRKLAEVEILAKVGKGPAAFDMDRQKLALPVFQSGVADGLMGAVRNWLGRMLILRPVPGLITGDSQQEILEPDARVVQYGDWFAGMMASTPAAYGMVEAYLKEVLPSLKEIKNPLVAVDSRALSVVFANAGGELQLPFEALSDGEKCFMIAALVLAAAKVHPPVFCFWDELDSHFALSEAGHVAMALRHAFRGSSQLLATSHHPEIIRKFSDENTFCLFRKSHLDPAQVRPLSEFQLSGDLINTLVIDGLEP